MDLITRIRGRMKTADLQQKTLALEFLERLDEDRAPARETVESRLSELLGSKARGVQFFLDRPGRQAALFDALGVPADERNDWTEAAEAFRARGPGARTRVVLDLVGVATGEESVTRMFRSVEVLLSDARLRPACLVVDDATFRMMPRSIDDLPDVTVERVADAAAAAARGAPLVDGGALVLSRNVDAPDDRWAVPVLTRQGLATVPTDAVGRFLAGERLAEPPPVAHDLGALLATVPEEHRSGFERLMTGSDGTFTTWMGDAGLPSPDSALRRQLRTTLGDPDVVHEHLTWGQRVALGARWGVPVAAAPAERAIAARWLAVDQLGADWRGRAKGTAGDLDALLRRAARRPVVDALFEVGLVLHVVNPSRAVNEGPYVVVHRIASETPLLQRLLDHVAAWTADDWDLDPDLERAVARLVAEGADPRLARHARATVLAHLPPPIEAPAHTDALGALRRILASDPPAARLQPAPGESKRDGRRPPLGLFARMPGDPEVPGSLTLPTLRPPCMAIDDDWARAEAHHLSAGDRLDDHVVVRRADRDQHPVVLPSSLDVDAWLGAADASPWVTPVPGDEVRSRGEPSLPSGRYPKVGRFPIPASTWAKADLAVAVLWHALRRAMRAPETTALHDGRVLLHVAGGLHVAVRARRRAVDERETLAVLPFELTIDHHGYESWGLGTRRMELADVFFPGGSYLGSVGPELPASVRLALGRDVVEITPVASPWLAGTDAHTEVGATLAAERRREAEEEAAREADDD